MARHKKKWGNPHIWDEKIDIFYVLKSDYPKAITEEQKTQCDAEYIKNVLTMPEILIERDRKKLFAIIQKYMYHWYI